MISALHKTMRDSDPDAALYWLARMLEAGEDPLFVARRLVRFAPRTSARRPAGAAVAVAAQQAAHFIGMPEGTPRSPRPPSTWRGAEEQRRVRAYGRAVDDAERRRRAGAAPPAQRADRADEGARYGKDYQYAHDQPDAVADMDCLPPSLRDRTYYEAKERGFEKEIKRRLEGWKEIKRKRGRETKDE